MTSQPQTEFSEDKPVPILELVHDGDRTRKYIMRCSKHPDLIYRSKDPRGGSAIIAHGAVCECSWVHLDVIGRSD